jgi:hypothetical protein
MSAHDPAPKAHPARHESNGRPAKANAGDPYARQVALLRHLVLARVRPEDLGLIFDKFVERAKEGNVAAARLVVQHTLGKPVATPHPDRLDAHQPPTRKAGAARDGVGPVSPAAATSAAGEKFLDDLIARLGDRPDTKRGNRRGSTPMSAGAADPIADTEALRLVNGPDRRAANDAQS